jgi:hypothetical protein
MSTSVGAGKPMCHKTTRTVDYGAGIIQRSTVHSFTDSAPARTASKQKTKQQYKAPKQKTKQQYKAPNEDDHATSPKDLVENEYGAALAGSIWLCIIVGLLITYPYETSIILGTIIVSGLVIAYWPIVLTCSIVYIIAKLLFF